MNVGRGRVRRDGRHRHRPGLEGLERRALMAASLLPGPVVDVSRLAGNEWDPAIAINPTNPNNIVVLAQSGTGSTIGLSESVSFDGGATWTTRTIADGSGILVPASGDPSLAFDQYGNLFAGYLDASRTGAVVALSIDGGQNFVCLATVTSPTTHVNGQAIPPAAFPKVAAGGGSVWIAFQAFANQPPASFVIAPGSPTTLTFGFADPDPDAFTRTPADYTASINWGDGAPATPGTVTGVAPTFTITGSHTYYEPGPYIATAHITDRVDGRTFDVNQGLVVSQVQEIVASGARVTGLGQVGSFSVPEAAGGSEGGGFDSIAVGPAGQVVVTYQKPIDDAGASTIYTNTDPVGINNPPAPGNSHFGVAVRASDTNVGGVDTIAPQPVHGINAAAGLAFDPFISPNGRLFLVYSDSPTISCGCVEVYERYSDDNGMTWSDRIKVNDNNDDDPFSPLDSANILPSVAVDPATGSVAVSFYSARNDVPANSTADRDGRSNTDVQLYATVSIDGGLTFSPNVQIANGSSEAAIAGHNGGQDFGDYTGLAYFNGSLYPAWADNSTTLVGNPDPNNFDIATSRVFVQYLTAGSQTLNLLARTPFSGVVATFTNTDPNTRAFSAADYVAQIDWGDGQPPTPGVVAGNFPTFAVLGSHTYAEAGNYRITVTIGDVPDGRLLTVISQAIVAYVPLPITGQLNPASDSGASDHDAITNVDQPNFFGTTVPGLPVSLYALAAGRATPTLVGQAVAGPDGSWSITTAPLADGSYTILATVVDAAGLTTGSTQILPSATEGPLIIDTRPPHVVDVQFVGPLSGKVLVTLQDVGASLDPASLVNPANYRLTRGSPFGPVVPTTAGVVGTSSDPNAPVPVGLVFGGGAPLRGTANFLDVVSGGIEDLAGNALDGEFVGLFPSGDGRPGGDFRARIDAIHRTIFPPQALTATGGYDPPAPRGPAALAGRWSHARPRPIILGMTTPRAPVGRVLAGRSEHR